MAESPEKTSKRKSDHLEICLNADVNFNDKTTGFENYDFIHNAVTEVNIKNVDLSGILFGKKINYPFLISSMTGGANEAERINSDLADIAEELKLALGVGSQRQALNDKKFIASYKIMRKNAPNVPLLGNIGAFQIAKSEDPVGLAKYLIEMIEADALIIHLNPLQELMQPEGETDFSGLLSNIEKIVNQIDVPIIAKEVGAGIGKNAAKRLLETGVQGIDVAGAGGTSWSEVEMKRRDTENNYFRNWGIPTAEALGEVNKLRKKFKFLLISSGGVDDGIKIAKSIALGADLAASAGPILKILFNSGKRELVKTIKNWFEDVKKIMYLTGCYNVNDLQKLKLVRR